MESYVILSNFKVLGDSVWRTVVSELDRVGPFSHEPREDSAAPRGDSAAVGKQSPCV